MANWTDLPIDILGRLVRHFEFIEDYDRFRAVCKSWRSHTPKEAKPKISLRACLREEKIRNSHMLYVGNLAAEVSEEILYDFFANEYPSVNGTVVVVDFKERYGIVRFGEESERTRAWITMPGRDLLGARMIFVPCPLQIRQGQTVLDSSNTTIFVGGLDDDAVTDDELRKYFAPFGNVFSVKILKGKRCGFVQFSWRKDAEKAMEILNGAVIGRKRVRLSWGRRNENKRPRIYGQNQGTCGPTYYTREA